MSININLCASSRSLRSLPPLRTGSELEQRGHLEEGLLHLSLASPQTRRLDRNKVETFPWLHTGTKDLFTDGQEGFIVEDRNLDMLSERMQRVADDPELQQRLSEAALIRVKQLGCWDHYGDLRDNLLHR